MTKNAIQSAFMMNLSNGRYLDVYQGSAQTCDKQLNKQQY